MGAQEPSQRRFDVHGLSGVLVILVAVSLTAGLGGLASTEAGSFYQRLDRPAWAPPGWVFAPVWTVLYLLMAIAASQVWWHRQRKEGSRTILGLFALSLVANGLWSWLFFAWRLGFWSVVDIVLLAALIVALIVLAWRHHPWAAVLWIPYLLWVLFAAVLNIVLWFANGELL